MTTCWSKLGAVNRPTLLVRKVCFFCFFLSAITLVIVAYSAIEPHVYASFVTNTNGSGTYVSICPGGLRWRRFGNHLFNFAAMLHVAKLSGRRVAMVRRHPNGWLDHVFNVNITRVRSIDRDLCPCYELYEISPMSYDSSLTTKLSSTNVTVGKSILVCGYTQSWRYTVGVEDELRRHLQPHEGLLNEVDLFLEDVVPERWLRDRTIAHERVGIHIRTGDFVKESMAADGYSIPQLPYFQQAMRYVVGNATSVDRTANRRRIQFIVVTESVDWCKNSIDLSSIARNLTSPTVDIDLVYSIGQSAQFDFVLLTKSDVTIITSGSYGWWAAWLANGTTIYYSNFPTPGSDMFQKHFKGEDYYPTNWIPFGGPWFNLSSS